MYLLDRVISSSLYIQPRSIVPQVKHFVESVFIREELDLGERQLGLAVSLDCDLDSFAAAVGFTRAYTLSYASQEGKRLSSSFLTKSTDAEAPCLDSTTIADEGMLLEEAIYEPVQRILNQVKTVKSSSL